MFKKLHKFFLYCAIFVIPLFSSAKATVPLDSVSDWELLLLSVCSYCNKPETSTSDMLKTSIKSYGILQSVTNISDLDGWQTIDHEIHTDGSCSGFSAFTFQKGNHIAIVPRGTDGGLVDENKGYVFKSEHPQTPYMIKYVQKTCQKLDPNQDFKIYFAGHSLGGYLALYGSGTLLQIPKFEKHFAETVTFNGLGLGHYTNSKVFKALRKQKNNISNYRIDGDVVSKIGFHISKMITLTNSSINPSSNSIWYKIPYATSHHLSQFFLHRPLLLYKKTCSFFPNIISTPKTINTDQKDKISSTSNIHYSPISTPNKVSFNNSTQETVNSFNKIKTPQKIIEA